MASRFDMSDCRFTALAALRKGIGGYPEQIALLCHQFAYGLGLCARSPPEPFLFFNNDAPMAKWQRLRI